MIEMAGEAITILTTDSAHALSNASYLQERTHQKLLSSRMVGRTVLDKIKSFSLKRDKRVSLKTMTMTAANGIHYASDETIGLAMLPTIKNSFAAVMPEGAAATTAVSAETLALTGIAMGLGLINLKARQNTPEDERDLIKKSGTVLTLGVPFAAQFGVLKQTKDVVTQSVTTFAGSHLLAAGGSLVAAEALNNPRIMYAAAAYVLGCLAIDTGYGVQEDVALAQLGSVETQPAAASDIMV